MPDCLLPGLVVSLSGLFFSHVEDHALIVYPNSSDMGDISHIPVQTTRNAKKPETASAEMARFLNLQEEVTVKNAWRTDKYRCGHINIGVNIGPVHAVLTHKHGNTQVEIREYKRVQKKKENEMNLVCVVLTLQN